MKLLNFSILFVFVVLLVACKPKSESTEMLSFSVSTEYDFIGLTQFEGEIHFCFLKKRFNPNLKIFNAKGVLKDSIPLSEVEKILGTIDYIYKISSDTIFIYGPRNKIMLAVNNNGVPLLEERYNHIIDENGYYYGLLPSCILFPFMSNDHNGMSCATITLDEPNTSTFKQAYDNVKQNGYLACKLTPFSEKRIDFGIRFSDIVEFSTLADSSYFFSFYSFITNVNGRSYMFSDHSRYVYELSEDFSVINSFKILDDQDIVVSAIPFDNTDDQNREVMDENVLQQHRTANEIRGIHYNSVTDNYLVIAKNGIIKDENWQNFPFKVLVYDSNFTNKIKEVEVNSYDYTPHKSFIMNGKLYMQKENQSHNTKDYEIIEL